MQIFTRGHSPAVDPFGSRPLLPFDDRAPRVQGCGVKGPIWHHAEEEQSIPLACLHCRRKTSINPSKEDSTTSFLNTAAQPSPSRTRAASAAGLQLAPVPSCKHVHRIPSRYEAFGPWKESPYLASDKERRSHLPLLACRSRSTSQILGSLSLCKPIHRSTVLSHPYLHHLVSVGEVQKSTREAQERHVRGPERTDVRRLHHAPSTKVLYCPPSPGKGEREATSEAGKTVSPPPPQTRP